MGPTSFRDLKMRIAAMMSRDRLRFLLNGLRGRLWLRPLAVCLLSIGAAFVARVADGTGLGEHVPEVAAESVVQLLSIMAASMLVVATFSVSSMVSAYASAGSTATPRSFPLVVADDVSQNALSSFIGAFIFSIVALTALKNDYFGRAGLFILFALATITFAIVILMLVHWVDRIARLGRLGSIIDKVEQATAASLKRRRHTPTLNAMNVRSGDRETRGGEVFAPRIGYVQHVDVTALQSWATDAGARVIVNALPGTFAVPGRALAHVVFDAVRETKGGIKRADIETDGVVKAFSIGDDRRFEDDPRFGLVALSEIASRALSPAVNDPGTAIDIIGTLVRLFAEWQKPDPSTNADTPTHDRVEVPELSIGDMFDDAFTGIARDGAGLVEVVVRLQKALAALAELGDSEMRDAARRHARLALKRAELAMTLPDDVDAVREAALR